MRWPDSPAEITAPVETFVQACAGILGDGLADVTLHGSLAMGCFNPAMSDVDLLVVTTRAPLPSELHAIARAAVMAARAVDLEMSIVRATDLDPFVHPASFDLHVSRSALAEVERKIAAGRDAFAAISRERDPDLAAHVVMGIARGVTLAGRPLRELCPGVHIRDLADSLAADHALIREHPMERPIYSLLNSCRLLHFALEGAISSKDEGAAWALEVLPLEHRPVVADALEMYTGKREPEPFDERAVRDAVEWMGARIDQLRDARAW